MPDDRLPKELHDRLPEAVRQARPILRDAARLLASSGEGYGHGRVMKAGGEYWDPPHRGLTSGDNHEYLDEIRRLAIEIIDELAWECDTRPEDRRRLVEAIRRYSGDDERERLARRLLEPIEDRE